MHFGRMTEIQEDLFQQIRTIRACKGMEYATETDTLADFKEVAAEVGNSPIQTWATYVKKHLRAVDNFVRSGDVRSESIESRILDVVTYHILLLGLIEDLREDRAVPEENAEGQHFHLNIDSDPTDSVEWTGPLLRAHDGTKMPDLGADADPGPCGSPAPDDLTDPGGAIPRCRKEAGHIGYHADGQARWPR